MTAEKDFQKRLDKAVEEINAYTRKIQEIDRKVLEHKLALKRGEVQPKTYGDLFLMFK